MGRWMLISASLWVWLLAARHAQAQTGSHPDDAQRLVAMARSLWAPVELQALGHAPQDFSADVAEHRIRKACLLLQAAHALDPSNAIALRDLTALMMTDVVNDPGRAIDALAAYSQLRSRDGVPIEAWVRYRLNSFGTRREREYYLQQETPMLGQYPHVQSLALTEQGILAIEKGDIESARTLFRQALNTSLYNDDALARLLELPPPPAPADEDSADAPVDDVQANPDLYLALRWRVRLRNDPYDLRALLNLVQILDGVGVSDLAQDYYEHAYTLLSLEPDTPERHDAVQKIRFQHLVSAYSAKLYRDCIRIAEELLADNADDLLVAGLQAGALAQVDMTDTAQTLLAETGDTAVLQWQQASAAERSQLVDELAWFFCFFDPDPARALQFAQAAYDANTVDPAARNILAYAHVLNGQTTQAETLLAQSDPNEPVAALALAKIQLSRDDADLALAVLQGLSGVGLGVLAPAVEQLLEELTPPPDETQPRDDGAEGSAPADVAGAELKKQLLRQTFASRFDQRDLSIVGTEAKHINCRLLFKEEIFSIDDPIMTQIHLSNTSKAGILLGDAGFLDPRVIITAQAVAVPASALSKRPSQLATENDTAQATPITTRYLAQQRVLPAGSTNSIGEPLNVGALRDELQQHPQQNYLVTFRTILDPVPAADGTPVGRVEALQPAPVTVIRKAFLPTQDRMKVQFRRLRSGSPNDRIEATLLLARLVHEAELARSGRLDYPVRQINEKAVRRRISENLSHPDFTVRAWSAYAMRLLGIDADDEAAHRLPALLDDEHWFVRFMAVDTLSTFADMADYLRWAVKIEEHQVVRRLVTFQSDQPWEIIDLPLELPDPNDLYEPDEPQDTSL